MSRTGQLIAAGLVLAALGGVTAYAAVGRTSPPAASSPTGRDGVTGKAGAESSSPPLPSRLAPDACPSFPADPQRPVFDGPPLPLSVLLRPADLARLGRGWRSLGDAHRAVLPVYGSEDRDPVLPSDQQSALYFQLSSGDRAGSSVQETVIRYAGGTGRTAAARWGAQFACGDADHSVRLLEKVSTSASDVQAYARVLRIATPVLTEPAVVDAWQAVVRWRDVLAVLVVRGGLANEDNPASATVLTGVTLARLQAAASG